MDFQPVDNKNNMIKLTYFLVNLITWKITNYAQLNTNEALRILL